MSNCGIYRIRNTRNNKSYIGSSKNFKERSYSHFYHLKNCIHANEQLQRAYNKEPDNFIFEILLICQEDTRIMYEQLFLDSFKPDYNMSHIAGYLQMTSEIKNKIRTAQTKHWQNNPERRKQASSTTTSIMSDYHIKQKHLAGLKAAWNEARRKQASLKYRGDNNPSKNINTRRRISETKKKNTQGICRLSWYNSCVMYQNYWGC